MSYCRWSSHDFQSDVYVYADVAGGYTTHVAGRRVVFNQPLPPRVPFARENLTAWLEREKQVGQMVEDSPTVLIELPGAGESFNDPTPGACADRLQALKAAGFRVPEFAIEALREEERGDG